MKLIVGLGNPGKEYKTTRHNVGWMVVDALVHDLQFEDLKKEEKFSAKLSAGEIGGEKIILAKPTTFMNLSGEAVSALKNFYKIEPEDIWVIYDDLDLPLGQLRIRKDGGPGTHNGMKSVIESVGSKDFPRFRIGIESRGGALSLKGEPSPKQQDTTSFVLSKFSEEETPLALEGMRKAINAVKCALEEGVEVAMNKFNA
ncbi:MAG TPA: aminoacyl-tRNA hydrolase [Candidatus Gracilibacteria bacterium]|nr:aminoacyl-tRNA hydrolase [Candidatus Gracilibacteria bacterium]